jgi:hypothetical protein
MRPSTIAAHVRVPAQIGQISPATRSTSGRCRNPVLIAST